MYEIMENNKRNLIIFNLVKNIPIILEDPNILKVTEAN